MNLCLTIDDAAWPSPHNLIAESINLPWSFGLANTPAVSSFKLQFREPSLVWAAVALPHKRTVIPILEKSDEHVKALGAGGAIWKTSDGRLV